MLICKQFLNVQIINENKTLSMVMSRILNPVQHPPLFTNETIISETTRHKHLGLTFSSTCTWTEHVDNVSGKAWTRLNLLRVFKFRVGRKSLENYISHLFDHYLNIVILYGATAHQNRQETVGSNAYRSNKNCLRCNQTLQYLKKKTFLSTNNAWME